MHEQSDRRRDHSRTTTLSDYVTELNESHFEQVGLRSEKLVLVEGFNPEYVRQELLRWKEKKTAKYPDSKYWERGKIAG
jgi:hypothetical protein